jgi:hypothetical protein
MPTHFRIVSMPGEVRLRSAGNRAMLCKSLTRSKVTPLVFALLTGLTLRYFAANEGLAKTNPISGLQTNAAPELPTSVTVDGITYEGVRWTRVTPTTVTIFHRTGIATIPLERLPPALQRQFGYNPQKAAAYAEVQARRRGADGLTNEAEAQERTKTYAAELRGLQNGCIAYYPFNGNADDESGNGHHGDVKGGTLCKDRFGRQDSAYQFNGSIGYIRTGIRDNIEAFSVWFVGLDYVPDSHDKPRSDTHGLGGFGGIVSQCSTDEDGFQLRRLGGRNFAEIKVANRGWDLQQIPFDGRWHHIVVTKNGSRTDVYCDGRFGTSIPSTWRSSGALKIGQGFDRTHRGMVDDVRIYNRPLTVQEVEALFRERPANLVDTLRNSKWSWMGGRPGDAIETVVFDSGPSQLSNTRHGWVADIESVKGTELTLRLTSKGHAVVDSPQLARMRFSSNFSSYVGNDFWGNKISGSRIAREPEPNTWSSRETVEGRSEDCKNAQEMALDDQSRELQELRRAQQKALEDPRRTQQKALEEQRREMRYALSAEIAALQSEISSIEGQLAAVGVRGSATDYVPGDQNRLNAQRDALRRLLATKQNLLRNKQKQFQQLR